MKTMTLIPRAVLLFAFAALAVTTVNAQGPSVGGLNGWTPGSNNNPLNQGPSPTGINNGDNSDNSNNNGDDNSDGNSDGNGNNNGDGFGSGSGSGNNGGAGSGGSGDGGSGNGSGNGNHGNSNGDSYGNGDSSSPFGPDMNSLNNSLEYASLVGYRVAHGALASLAFAFLFPLGAILLRSVPGKPALVSHWIIQVVASVLYLGAAGLGLYLLSILRIPSGAGLLEIANGNAHPIIGIALLIALFLQPIFGVVHHRRFKKFGRRTWASHVHLWIGRVGITLGIVNGGLGLALAGTKGAPVLAYVVVSVVMWSLWILTTLLRAYRDSKARRELEKTEIMGNILQDDTGHGVASAHIEDVGFHHRNIPVRPRTAAAAAAAPPPTAEQDIPSPPYTPGPHYAAHMANLDQQRQRQAARGEMQSMKEAMDTYETLSIISASQDEMRRGQV